VGVVADLLVCRSATTAITYFNLIAGKDYSKVRANSDAHPVSGAWILDISTDYRDEKRTRGFQANSLKSPGSCVRSLTAAAAAVVVMATVMTMAATATAVTGADVGDHRAQHDQHQGDFREQLHNVLLAEKRLTGERPL
jgi:hypothetical protein